MVFIAIFPTGYMSKNGRRGSEMKIGTTDFEFPHSKGDFEMKFILNNSCTESGFHPVSHGPDHFSGVKFQH